MADSFLLTVWTTPSRLVLRLLWDNEVCQFWLHSLTEKKVCFSTRCLCHDLRSWTEAAVQTGLSSYYRNSYWDDNPDLSGFKIGWDIARDFVMWAVLTVLPPDFLNNVGDINHDVSGRFYHLVNFSPSTVLMIQFLCIADAMDRAQPACQVEWKMCRKKKWMVILMWCIYIHVCHVLCSVVVMFTCTLVRSHPDSRRR